MYPPSTSSFLGPVAQWKLIELIAFNLCLWNGPIKHIVLKWPCCIDKIPHTYVVVMGDPKFSSYLSVLGIKVYNLTGVGLESGQRYVCKMSEFLGVQIWWPATKSHST